MIDLHMHSTYSDGTCTIEEILSQAKTLGLSQISITDHNIIEGSIKAKQLSDVDFVVGTELSCDYHGVEIHLLAYFPYVSDYKHTEFIIKESESYKKIAIVEMIENLNNMGYEINVNELAEFANGSINRVHICNVLMKHGYIKSVSEGFEKLIGDHCDAYVQRKVISIFEAIDAIHQDNGIAVIAHPYEYENDLSLNDFLNDVIDKVDGIECFHPSANKQQSKFLVELANTHNKRITGGSDFHGKNKPNIFMNMMEVDDYYKIK